MYKLSSQYKKYRRMDAGGNFDSANNRVSTGIGVANGAAGIVDGVFGTDNMGRQPVGASIASGALRGAAIGSLAGPVGTAAGAVIGAGYSFFKNRAQKGANDQAAWQRQELLANQQRKQSEAAIAQDPSLVAGNQFASFYAMGGQMDTAGGTTLTPAQRQGAQSKSRPLAENYLTRNTQAIGGSMTPLSDDSVAFNGPSHAEGGIQLPDEGAEVEGGETMKGNFVFSERLGFAQEHKRIAGAIGKIQAKGTMAPERVNAIRRLQEREQQLALSQEYLKHILSGGKLPDPTQQPQP